LFSYPRFIGNNVTKNNWVREADVIYIHWILGGFFNFKNIRQVLEMGKPVIFFMHDMWTITGGCHHSLGCEGYKTDSTFCPIFKGDKKYTLASREFKIKKELFKDFSNISFVSPSNWLANCASQSGLTGNKKVEIIPNIINEEVFKPVDKQVARKLLNLDSELFTISFGAVAGTTNIFKGWSYLEEALQQIHTSYPDLQLNIIIFGSNYDQGTVDALPYPVRFLGEINDETTMVILNNASDLFISPTLAENFGQTLLENVMCGTPVVAFNVGGNADIIEHKVNGYLAEYKSSEDLAAGIVYCISNKLAFEPPDHYFKKLSVEKHVELMGKMLHG
jgi:glycosyltransferase involved in cell wall biosynthesis